ncbi:MAG: hypothetical protein Q8R58_01430 [Sulfuricurvum sp.]|nr:hypothetical protein [Sulfuricurvum sp.]
MKQIDSSSINIDEYFNAIDVESIKTKLSDAKYHTITNDLENIIKADLNTIKNDYLALSDSYSPDEIKEIEKAFNYTAHRKKVKFMEYFKKLNIKSCPFCNNNYIYFYTEDARKFNTLATLEHYYPKGKYPHLSLSFYNLIPSCSTCNSKFKGNVTHEGEILHPYYEDFDDKAKFSVGVDSLSVHKSIKLSVKLESNDDRCKKSIDRFQLDKIYTQHSDIAQEIWNKAQVYNDSRIDELYESFYKNLGYSKEEVKNMIFCNYLDQKDINKRNHAKLTQDILKQFELIRK